MGWSIRALTLFGLSFSFYEIHNSKVFDILDEAMDFDEDVLYHPHTGVKLRTKVYWLKFYPDPSTYEEADELSDSGELFRINLPHPTEKVSVPCTLKAVGPEWTATRPESVERMRNETRYYFGFEAGNVQVGQAPQKAQMDLDIVEEALRRFLEPRDLWFPDRFGVYTIRD